MFCDGERTVGARGLVYLGERCGGCVKVQEREVGLAVLANPVGEGLDAPIFGLGDLSAHLFDDVFVLRGHFVNLLRRDVLARHVDVFIQRHAA